MAHHLLRQRKESDAALKKLIATHQNDCAYQIAEAYAYRGENNEAFHWLDRAVRQCDAGAPELKRSPLMISLRKDPRYAGLLKQLHLAD
jgi:adenylate cyclase